MMPTLPYHSEPCFGAICIPLTQGYHALIDIDDYQIIASKKWHAKVRKTNVYAGSYKGVKMHREIIGTPMGMDTDHINRNGLDNRKKNLRPVSRLENIGNTEKYGKCPYKGIAKNHKGWTARIGYKNTEIYLGTFPTAEKAAMAYDEAALERYGECAYLNFPDRIKSGER